MQRGSYAWMQHVKSNLFEAVSLMWGMAAPAFSTHAPLFDRDRPQGFFWTNVFSRAFWIDTGICPSSTRADLTSMIISDGLTSLGHRSVQAPQEVQYQGRASSISRWNCRFLTSIRMLKAVRPASGQLPVHFPHWMQVNTLLLVIYFHLGIRPCALP